MNPANKPATIGQSEGQRAAVVAPTMVPIAVCPAAIMSLGYRIWDMEARFEMGKARRLSIAWLCLPTLARLSVELREDRSVAHGGVPPSLLPVDGNADSLELSFDRVQN